MSEETNGAVASPATPPAEEWASYYQAAEFFGHAPLMRQLIREGKIRHLRTGARNHDNENIRVHWEDLRRCKKEEGIGDMLSLDDAARLIGMTYDQLRGYAMHGRLQARRVGHKQFVSREELERFKAAWKPKDAVPEGMVSFKDTAEAFKCSVTVVEGMVKRNGLTTHRINRQRYLSADDYRLLKEMPDDRGCRGTRGLPPRRDIATVGQAAAFLKKVPWELGVLLRNGDLPYVLVNKDFGIPWEALHEFKLKGPCTRRVPQSLNENRAKLPQDLMQARLEKAGLALNLDDDVWSRLAEIVLPEVYAPAPKPEPTDALPGSERKIQVMEKRLERGEAIFGDDVRDPEEVPYSLTDAGAAPALGFGLAEAPPAEEQEGDSRILRSLRRTGT